MKRLLSLMAFRLQLARLLERNLLILMVLVGLPPKSQLCQDVDLVNSVEAPTCKPAVKASG
ncbi:hypothetical protein A2U01_0083626, partial [Trifolium medium]|nr:hypothetical protein [Trifolium medium]